MERAPDWLCLNCLWAPTDDELAEEINQSGGFNYNGEYFTCSCLGVDCGSVLVSVVKMAEIIREEHLYETDDPDEGLEDD